MKEERIVLSNGIDVRAIRDWSMKSVSILVDVYSGSRDDRAGLEGEHHAFEHMPFRGTYNFPDALALLQPLERYGVNVGSNVNTGYDRTRYSFEVPKEQFEIGAVHLCDLVYRPLLRAEDWQEEKHVIIQEWKERAMTDHDTIFYGNLLKRVFTEKGMHHDPIGKPESISSVSAQDLKEVQSSDYTAENSQVVLTGAIPGDYKTVLERSFGLLDLPQGTSRKVSGIVPEVEGRSWQVSQELFHQPYHIMAGFYEKPSYQEKIAIGLFVTMVNGGMSSPLWLQLRDKLQLVYSYGVNPYFIIPGVFVLQIILFSDLNKIPSATECVWEVVERTKSDFARFEFAKDRMLGELSLRNDSPEKQCDRFADDLLHEEGIHFPKEEIEAIRAATFDQVQEAADTYFNRDKFCMLTMSA